MNYLFLVALHNYIYNSITNYLYLGMVDGMAVYIYISKRPIGRRHGSRHEGQSVHGPPAWPITRHEHGTTLPSARHGGRHGPITPTALLAVCRPSPPHRAAAPYNAAARPTPSLTLNHSPHRAAATLCLSLSSDLIRRRRP
jgi:hypothetical protein